MVKCCLYLDLWLVLVVSLLAVWFGSGFVVLHLVDLVGCCMISDLFVVMIDLWCKLWFFVVCGIVGLLVCECLVLLFCDKYVRICYG